VTFRRWIETEPMNAPPQGHREPLLDGLRRFVASARQIAGVRRIAVLGSIVTTKPDPKDIDVLVVVADDADLAPLAKCSRRLQGHAQGFNRGADVFLAASECDRDARDVGSPSLDGGRTPGGNTLLSVGGKGQVGAIIPLC
jgi:predicted nucleotidyltransferase